MDEVHRERGLQSAACDMHNKTLTTQRCMATRGV
jgi:hypothetical protein